MPKRKQSLGHATRNAKRMKSRAKNADIQTRDFPTHQPQLPQAYKYDEQTFISQTDIGSLNKICQLAKRGLQSQAILEFCECPVLVGFAHMCLHTCVLIIFSNRP